MAETYKGDGGKDAKYQLRQQECEERDQRIKRALEDDKRREEESKRAHEPTDSKLT